MFSVVANRATILLAEDDRMDAELLERGFQRASMSFTLKTVNDGTEVLAYLRGEGKYSDRREYPLPDLLLLDMRMPRMDGFQVLSWLQRHGDYCKMPVILIGSSLSPESMIRACECGASCVLSKTNDMKKFAGELKQLIEIYLPCSSAG